MESKFLSLFQVLQLIKKQVNKLKHLKKWKIQNAFDLSLLEYDTIRKRQIENKVENIKPDFDFSNNQEYEVENIKNNAIYARKSWSGVNYQIYTIWSFIKAI